MSGLATILFRVLFVLTPVFFLVLGLLVLVAGRQRWYTRMWGTFSLLAAATWICIILSTTVIPSLATASFVSRLAFCFGSVACSFLVAFTVGFVERQKQFKYLLIALFCFSTVLVFLFLFTDLLTLEMAETEFNLRYAKPGPLMPLYGIFVLATTGFSAGYVAYFYNKSTGQRQLRLRYVSIALAIFFLVGLGSLLPSYFGPGSALAWIPLALMILVPTLVSYAIVRHRLWDIRTVLHRTVLWLLVSAVIITPLYLLLLWGWPSISQFDPVQLLLVLIGAYLFIMLLIRLVQPRVDHRFGRRTLNRRQQVDDFLRDSTQLMEPAMLGASLKKTVRETLYPEFVRFLMFDPESESLSDLNDPHAEPVSLKRAEHQALADWLVTQQQEIVEVGVLRLEDPRQALASGFFSLRNTALAMPLAQDQQLLGLVELGGKQNLGAYTRDEFELLARIQAAARVALANATLYRNIQNLTISLEERVQARTAELEQAYQKLKELDRQKSRFFTNITHELRTPLTLILAPLEDALLALRGEPGDSMLIMIHRQAVRLHTLINNLLDLSKIDSDELRLRIETLNLSEIVATAVTAFQFLASRKQIKLSHEPTIRPVVVAGDQYQLEKVITNLLGNAVKFTQPGGSINLRLFDGSHEVVLEVEDTGIGIPEQQLERIFDRFAQVEDDETRSFEGSGVGLSLVKEIVELHGGRVSVESAPASGSTFRIRLNKQLDAIPVDSIDRRKIDVPTGFARRSSDLDPLSWVKATTIQELPTDSKPPLPPTGNGATKPTILVVEDNDDMRGYVQSVLGSAFRILTAKDGVEALESIDRSLPDLVISDVMMPRMTGHELCRQLKSRNITRAVPVILLTAKKGIDLALQGFESGADDYLTKPFSSRELLARVNVQLKLRMMAQQLAIQEKIAVMGFLSSGLAHEVKNPANAIINAISPLRRLVGERAGESGEAIEELLECVHDGSSRIIALCNDLLNVADPNLDSHGPWNPSEPLKSAVRILKHKYPGSCTVVHRFGHDSPVFGHRTRLNQLVLNLLANAFRAATSVTDGEIVIETGQQQENLTIRISDNGAGISPDVLPHIFEPLFTTNDVGDGTGLGLYITRRIVLDHGGTIHAESTRGEGTTLSVALPFESPPA